MTDKGSFMIKKLLIGGSPCTHWSIAQTKDRETEPKGLGWDLFENFLIALEKFQPDFFLYENNKSMSAAIRAEITKRFGFEPICINSALVSAQNRQRLYWVGKRNPDGTYSRVDVQQPEDLGILVRDILENNTAEQGYRLKEPASVSWRGRGDKSQFEARKDGKTASLTTGHQNRFVSEPVRVGAIESGTSREGWDSKQYRVYSPDGKSVTLCGQGGGVGAKTGLYACHFESLSEEYYHGGFDGGLIGMIENPSVCRNGKQPSQQYRVYTCDGKAVCVDQDQRKHYFMPATGTEIPVYEVRNGLITLNGKQYPIKLADGFYIIRKLTVLECMRLQTVPEWYVFPVSNTQAYKMLGNGWTVDVIAHIMSHFEGLTAGPLDVLSMYDGMACGHIALDKLGAQIFRYRATEIDKYAIKTACHNFHDIEQLGDAFQVREW